jgi:PIN domain nuclease of toxin-antitoxin system
MMLLDTCTLLWLVGDQTQLSKLAKECIGKNAGSLYISAISAFEIAIKVEKKKLFLPKDPAEWFALALKLHGIIELPLSAEYLIQSAQLPTHHHDPADRMIIATAKCEKYKIITPDLHIKQYTDISVIW